PDADARAAAWCEVGAHWHTRPGVEQRVEPGPRQPEPVLERGQLACRTGQPDRRPRTRYNPAHRGSHGTANEPGGVLEFPVPATRRARRRVRRVVDAPLTG